MGGHESKLVGRVGQIQENSHGTFVAQKLSQKQAVLGQVSARFQTLAENLKSTLEDEAKGPRHGPIVYFVLDPTKDPGEPEVRRQLMTDNMFGIGADDIKATPGFERLQARCRELGRKFAFKQELPEIMWDPKDGYEDSFVWHISISPW